MRKNIFHKIVFVKLLLCQNLQMLVVASCGCIYMSPLIYCTLQSRAESTRLLLALNCCNHPLFAGGVLGVTLCLQEKCLKSPFVCRGVLGVSCEWDLIFSLHPLPQTSCLLSQDTLTTITQKLRTHKNHLSIIQLLTPHAPHHHLCPFLCLGHWAT